MIRDFKGRLYEILGANIYYTYLKCLQTGDEVTIANAHFKACGFIA